MTHTHTRTHTCTYAHRDHYIQDLCERYDGDPSGFIPVELPDWCAEEGSEFWEWRESRAAKYSITMRTYSRAYWEYVSHINYSLSLSLPHYLGSNEKLGELYLKLQSQDGPFSAEDEGVGNAQFSSTTNFFHTHTYSLSLSLSLSHAQYFKICSDHRSAGERLHCRGQLSHSLQRAAWLQLERRRVQAAAGQAAEAGRGAAGEISRAVGWVWV